MAASDKAAKGPKDSAYLYKLHPKNKLAQAIPQDGLDVSVQEWDAIETFAKHRSNFERRAENWVFVKAFDASAAKEFRATSSKGWYRVEAGLTMQEPASRELLAWLHNQGLVVPELIDRTGPLITRQITAEERQICLGPSRGRPLNPRSASEVLSQVEAMRIMKRKVVP